MARISWWQVPERVRSAVEASLGARVAEAVSQESGYSPGAAARLRLTNGGRAFVKALSEERHANSVRLYRSEARAMPRLPAGLPVPRLIDVYDDGSWVALVYDEVEGRHPEIPWPADELERVMGAIGDLTTALDPSPWRGAPLFAEANATFLAAWRSFVSSPPSELDPTVRRLLADAAAEGVELEAAVQGDALLHNDIRSDNILLAPDGRVVFLDWATPCRGAAWLDLVMFAFTVEREGADADRYVRSHALTRGVPRTVIDLMVAAGYVAYHRLTQLPPDPLMPEVLEYQTASAQASLRWLRRRRIGVDA